MHNDNLFILFLLIPLHTSCVQVQRIYKIILVRMHWYERDGKTTQPTLSVLVCGIPIHIEGPPWHVVKASRFKLLAPFRWGSVANPMRGGCQLLMEVCWFTPRNSVFIELWKLTAI